jgi:hypothetical protein
MADHDRKGYMKRTTISVWCCAALLSACSWLPWGRHDAAPQAVTRKPAPSTDAAPPMTADGVEITKVPFRAGVSSATVEQLAKQRGCVGGLGAGLVTEPGPVEVYRMACDSGKVFMARCDLKQCKAM